MVGRDLEPGPWKLLPVCSVPLVGLPSDCNSKGVDQMAFLISLLARA